MPKVMGSDSASRKRPNILIIYPDQMRADAMGCADNPCIRTPNIDRLASEGVMFENAFTAFPLCSPFRGSLFTGKYPHTNGMRGNHYPMPLGQSFLPEILRDSGYRTGYVGKWHLDGGIKHGWVPPGERRLGFEHFVGFNRGHKYFKSIYYRDTDQPCVSDRYEPDYQTDHLIEFMSAAADDPENRPFFGMICYGLPHPPLVAPEHYLNLYPPEDVPIAANVPQDDQSQRNAREFLAKYYGLTTCVDDNVGKVLEWMDGRGIAEDTAVIFVSDHGDMGGEHGLYGKKVPYRSSMQVPLIVRLPRRLAAGRVVEGLVDPSVDIAPTLLELCGLDVPDGVQGTSFLPLLDGTETSTREEVYYEICMEKDGPERFPVPERGVRSPEWLYVRNEQGPTMLFDLKADPLELDNLADSPEHKSVIERLDKLLSEHMERTDDDWSLAADFPPPDFQTHAEGAAYAEQLTRRATPTP